MNSPKSRATRVCAAPADAAAVVSLSSIQGALRSGLFAVAALILATHSVAQTAQPTTNPGQAPQTQAGQGQASQFQFNPAQRQTAAARPAQNTAPAPEMMSPRIGAAGTRLVNDVVDSVAPLTPEEVQLARRLLEERRAAAHVSVSGPPAKPTTSAFNLDLSPGGTPPLVRIDRNQGAIVSFLDSAGRPWPGLLAENFAGGQIVVTQFSENQFSVGLAPGAGAAAGAPVNAIVAVALEGLPTAITFTVVSQQTHVDTTVNLVVPRYRGGAPAGVGALRGEPSLTAGDLMSYLLKTPPPSARALTVEGLAGAMAWQSSPSRMVLRTTELVASGFFRQQGLGDGTVVYELPISPVVRVASGGSIRSVRVNGIAPPNPSSHTGSVGGL